MVFLCNFKTKRNFFIFFLIFILKFPSASVIPVTHQGERLQVLLVYTDLNDIKFLREYILVSSLFILYYILSF